MPTIDPKKGAFKITAQVEGARLAYVPTSLQDSGDLPWPVLTDLSGELVIDRMQLQVNKARARLGEATALQVSRVEARIADLMQAQVEVDADFKGPLPELMGLVNASPLRDMTGAGAGQQRGHGQCRLQAQADAAACRASTSPACAAASCWRATMFRSRRTARD